MLGQVYDHAMKLRQQHGIHAAFVLLTTFTDWRVVWLDDGYSQLVANSEDYTNIPLREELTTTAMDALQRIVRVSKVVRGEHNPPIAHFLGSVLLKMVHSPKSLVWTEDRIWPCLTHRGMSWKKQDISRAVQNFPKGP